MREQGQGETRGRGSADPEHWVRDHGDMLFRYALVRVGDREVARDLVQETLLAGLQASARFAGRSKVGTWLVAILRNKIADHFRARAREHPSTEPDLEAAFFREDGTWREPPEPWAPDPGEVLGRRQFWQALKACLATLSPRHASAFVLRELEGMGTGELCEALQSTPGNAWVILHRARLALRRCLARSGFTAVGEEG